MSLVVRDETSESENPLTRSKPESESSLYLNGRESLKSKKRHIILRNIHLVMAFLLKVVFFLAVALTSSSLITERSDGLLDRAWVAGVNPSEVLLSHIVTQFFVMFGQTILVIITMFWIFDLVCKGSLILVVILAMLNGLCGMCFGFVISAICDLERNAIQMALGSFYPTLLLSGILWPLEAMPKGLMKVANFLPLTYATTSMRNILARDWKIWEFEVYIGFISTSCWIVLFLGASLLILRARRG